MCVCVGGGGHTHQLSLVNLEPAGDAWKTLDQSQGCPLHPKALREQGARRERFLIPKTSFTKTKLYLCFMHASLAETSRFNYQHAVGGKHVGLQPIVGVGQMSHLLSHIIIHVLPLTLSASVLVNTPASHKVILTAYKIMETQAHSHAHPHNITHSLLCGTFSSL